MSTECPYLKGNDVFQCHPRTLPAARDKMGFKPEDISLSNLRELLCINGDDGTREKDCPARLEFIKIGPQSIYARRTTNNHK